MMYSIIFFFILYYIFKSFVLIFNTITTSNELNDISALNHIKLTFINDNVKLKIIFNINNYEFKLILKM